VPGFDEDSMDMDANKAIFEDFEAGMSRHTQSKATIK
jgi:hypothetical protein